MRTVSKPEGIVHLVCPDVYREVTHYWHFPGGEWSLLAPMCKY